MSQSLSLLVALSDILDSLLDLHTRTSMMTRFHMWLYADRHLLYENQSVENAGVAFVKGANERNGFFEKKKKTAIYDELVRAN